MGPSANSPDYLVDANISWATPLMSSGSLDRFESRNLTPVIGLEFSKLQLREILGDDNKIRDLAILVSQRGVVFFKNQDLNIEDQKILGQKLGGLLESRDRRRHPLTNSREGIAVDENGKLDDEVSVLSSQQNRKYYKERFAARKHKLASDGWHADITFENVSSDYVILKMLVVPDVLGGDTLWASGYEAYDTLSPRWQQLAESMTATHYHPAILETAAEHGIQLIEENRGSPGNYGTVFKASNPVVRTNPVTGCKSLLAVGHEIRKGWFNDVNERESEIMKAYFLQLITEIHDLQVRYQWEKNDLAIWDNRSTFHIATNDYEGRRQGNRVVYVGEKPFYSPFSTSLQQSLGLID